MGQPFRFIHGHVRSPLKGPNRFKLRRGTPVIFLERRGGTVLECLVSRKDFDRVRRHHWYANKNGKRTFYAAAWIDGEQVHMHKYLCPNWTQVNHENGDGLDNRRENLRGVGRANWVGIGFTKLNLTDDYLQSIHAQAKTLIIEGFDPIPQQEGQ